MYVSIDLETTGLEPENNQILMISAVWDDLVTPLERCPHFTCIVDNGDRLTGNPFALHLNAWILAEILKSRRGEPTRYQVVDKKEAEIGLLEFFDKHSPGGDASVTVAGKNAAGFDIPFLKAHFSQNLTSRLNYRVLDPGSMYAFLDGKPAPGLPAIKRHIGAGDDVSHDAYEDALDVCRAIRFFRENGRPPLNAGDT